MVASKRSIQLAGRFIDIASRYTCEGWIEYLLWETIEGTRDRPFMFMDLLPDDELEDLKALRDEVKVWLSWQNNKWNPVPIKQWREHAAQRTANDVLKELNDKR